VSKDVRIRGHFSKPKGVRELKSLENNELEYNTRYGEKRVVNVLKIQTIQKISVYFIYYLAVYLTTLSNMVDEILRRLVRSVNMELEIKWKEAIGAYFKLLYRNFPAGMEKNHENFRSACSNFYVVRATLAKFGLYAGNMKFNKHNEE